MESRSAVPLCTDRFAWMRCNVRRSIRNSAGSSGRRWSRRRAQRRNSMTSGAASYHPRGVPGSTQPRRTTRAIGVRVARRADCSTPIPSGRARAARKLEQSLGRNLDQPTKPQHGHRPSATDRYAAVRPSPSMAAACGRSSAGGRAPAPSSARRRASWCAATSSAPATRTPLQ
jgi:hypothetical protein